MKFNWIGVTESGEIKAIRAGRLPGDVLVAPLLNFVAILRVPCGAGSTDGKKISEAMAKASDIVARWAAS